MNDWTDHGLMKVFAGWALEIGKDHHVMRYTSGIRIKRNRPLPDLRPVISFAIAWSVFGKPTEDKHGCHDQGAHTQDNIDSTA
jgi:hypothetical protein